MQSFCGFQSFIDPVEYAQTLSHKQTNALCNRSELFLCNLSPSFPHQFVFFSSVVSHVAPAGRPRKYLVCQQRFSAFLPLHRKQDRTFVQREEGGHRHSGL